MTRASQEEYAVHVRPHDDGTVATLLQVPALGGNTDGASPGASRQRRVEIANAEIAAADVLLLGVGGLGSGVLQSLVGLGVGRIRLVDAGTVEERDLARQVL